MEWSKIPVLKLRDEGKRTRTLTPAAVPSPHLQDVGAAAPADDEPADEAVASGILAAANGRPTASAPGVAPAKKAKVRPKAS